MSQLSFFSVLALFFVSPGWAGAPYPTDEVERFLLLESENSMVVRTNVSPEYRPAPGKVFDLPYIDLPERLLGTVEGRLPESLAKHYRIKKGTDERFIRFFFHPDSVELFKPLIDRFGITGYYRSAPTTSTRTLIAWHPDDPASYFFVKTSLAKDQDRLGRIVPGWEVRRSVGVSDLFDRTAESATRPETSLIPEPAGAYLKSEVGIGFHVDANQGKVFEIGFILRDADFLRSSYGEVFPFFALFTARKGASPRIVEWFRASGEKEIHAFIERTILEPFIEKTARLLFVEGILPEMHSQNTVVAVDPKSRMITHVYHRDIGSMKVDIRNRIVRGASIGSLFGQDAAGDFKFHRAPEVVDELFLNYFHEMTFGQDADMGYARAIQKHVPEFAPAVIRKRVSALYLQKMRKWLPLEKGVKPRTGRGHLYRWYREHKPSLKAGVDELLAKSARTPEFPAWAARRFEDGQYLPLPTEWGARLGTGFTPIGQGLVEKKPGGKLLLYHWDAEMNSTTMKASVCSRALRAESAPLNAP